MGRVLDFLGKHGTHALFLGVFLGIALPDLATLARPLLAPAVAGMLLLALLRVDWGTMAAYARRPAVSTPLILWLILLSPVLVWLALMPLPLPQPLAIAIALMAAAPPILGAAAISLLLGLDGALAVIVGLASTLLVPLTLPPLALLLLGLELDISVGEFMLRLALVVLGAFIGALLLRRWLGLAWLRERARRVDGLLVLTMVIFAVAVMDGVTDTLLTRPATVALWLGAAFLANTLLQSLGVAAFFWMGRRQALTVGLMTGNRNMGLLVAALPPDTDFDVVLYFALGQLPMYMLPALLRPLYLRALPGLVDGSSRLP